MASSARHSRPPKRAARAVRAPQSYAEPTTDDEDELYSDEEDGDISEEIINAPVNTRTRGTGDARRDTSPRRRPPKRQRPTPPTRYRYASDTSRLPDSHAPKKRKQSIPNSIRRSVSKPTTVTKPASQEERGSGVIPPWQNLPYHILVQIFEYASYPIYDDRTFQPNSSCRKLLSIAHLCRAFAEPAFTVLYSSPPLVPMEKAHKLVNLLNDPTPKSFAYRQKVESLRIDVGQVATYSLSGYGHLDLHSLVKNLPRLLDLEFYHQKDMPPYRNLDDTIKWTYPDSLFEALEKQNPEAPSNSEVADLPQTDKSRVTHLRSWRWSSRLAGKDRPVERLREIHLSAPFTSLRKLSFVNYHVPILRKDEDDPKHEQRLSESLAVLKNLEHLVFESSTLANAKLLPLLPTSLRNLELINCWEIVAEDFARFLLTHGSQLRCMTLNHNQSLSLSWLPSLAAACSHLQVLRIDLGYFNLHATYRDSEPQYERLLLPGEVPTWPRALQILEITEARKWEAEAAEMFFQSLVSNAADLPDLRHLVIHGGLINLGWRDRATFRDNWEKTLGRVFKRELESCRKHLSLSDGFTKGQGEQAPFPAEAQASLDAKAPVSQSPIRRSSRSHHKTNSNASNISAVAETILDPSGSGVSEGAGEGQLQKFGDDDQPLEPSPPTRRSTRQSAHPSQSGKYAEDSSSDHESDKEKPQRSTSGRETKRISRIAREVEILKKTAGHIYAQHDDLPASPPTVADDSNSQLGHDISLRKNKGKQREHIQGLCEVVDIKIDNQRPTEWQVTEADFLDSEPEGDDDWNGDDDTLHMPAGYAW